jgi:hypothetical protein
MIWSSWISIWDKLSLCLYPYTMVVYDDCMVGSERVSMEASLFGALVITNRCNVGSRFADAPFPSRLAGSPEANITLSTEELVTAIVNSLQNFEDFWQTTHLPDCITRVWVQRV